LVKLSITKEKRLMIDIMALCQSYEGREITEIRWINGKDNAAQCQNPTKDHMKLFIFVDGSFVNNKDFSSQIGYVMILANENPTANGNPNETDKFTIKGNLIHYSSTKCKRVTRSVLASEIYGMAGGVDMAVAVNTTIKMITDQLGFSHPVIIICTDSYSLYECLVKLGMTKEKRLMIDIMALRQSYK
jgi:hypothetical protein